MKIFRYILPKIGETIEVPSFPPGKARIVQVEQTGHQDARGYSTYSVWIEVVE
jgi:hypothetical protein